MLTIDLKPHHAYLVLGDPIEIQKALWDFFTKKWNVSLIGNPDFSHHKVSVFTIDMARSLKHSAQNKSFTSGKKIFVLETDSIPIEAQNSLLKLLEEPTPDTHFFVYGACVAQIVPTLRSRFLQIKIGEENNVPNSHTAWVDEFLKASVHKRLTQSKTLADAISDGKQTRGDALHIGQTLLFTLYTKVHEGTLRIPEPTFTKIEKAISYLNDTSASIKMIFEYIALILPQPHN